MIELRETTWDSKEYDSCGSTVYADLEINGITIPLCLECLNELIQTVETYKNTRHCYECKDFIPSDSGANYDGSCLYKARQSGENEIAPQHVGYRFPVTPFNPCNYGIKKEPKEQEETVEEVDLRNAGKIINDGIQEMSEYIKEKVEFLNSVLDQLEEHNEEK